MWRSKTPKIFGTSGLDDYNQWIQASVYSTTQKPAVTSTLSLEDKPDRILYGSWIDHLPAKLAPYASLARVDKPIGTWLLFWPCAWAVSMASYSAHVGPAETGMMIALFGASSFVMRSIACTVNDVLDRDFDRQVERTKNRPVASGTVSVNQAMAFTGLQTAVLASIFSTLNECSIFLSASAMAMLVTYPLMKRITHWPQLILGISFNYGALAGWSAMTGACDLSVCGPLYLGSIAWTLAYDTIYAHQDKKDDVKAGVKSTALFMGDRTPIWLTGFSSFFVGATALAGYMNGQGIPFYLISVGGAAAHLTWQLKTVNYDNPKSCWEKFQSNRDLGAIVWSGIVADTAYMSLLAA